MKRLAIVLALAGFATTLAGALVSHALPNCFDVQANADAIGNSPQHMVCSVSLGAGLHHLSVGWSAGAIGHATADVFTPAGSLLTVDCYPLLGVGPCRVTAKIPHQSFYDPTVTDAPLVDSQQVEEFALGEPATAIFAVGPRGVAATVDAGASLFGMTTDDGVAPLCFLLHECPSPCPTVTPSPTGSPEPSPTPTETPSPRPILPSPFGSPACQ